MIAPCPDKSTAGFLLLRMFKQLESMLAEPSDAQQSIIDMSVEPQLLE
jgi:hypothetical protein